MPKNLMEAAAEILNKSKASAPGDPMQKLKLPLNIKTMDLGDAVVKATDSIPDFTGGTPTATPPGQTPSVGKMPMQKLANQPGESMGRKDLAGDPTGATPSLDGIVNRQKNTKDTVAPGQSKAFREGVEVTDEDLEDLVNEARTWKDGFDRSTQIRTWKDKRQLANKASAKGDSAQREKRITAKEAVEQVLEAAKLNINEDVNAIFAGQEIPEEFVSKAATIFEAAVNSRVTSAAQLMETKLEEVIDSEIEIVKADLEEKIDAFLGYTAEEWVKENQLVIESGVKTEIAESFISGLKTLFAEHYIEIPEEKVDVVSELADEVNDLKEQLNSEIAKNMNMVKQLHESKKQDIIRESCDGLTLVQKEKIVSLAESIDFEDEEQFVGKINILKENYFQNSNVKVPSKDSLNNSQLIVEEEKNVKVVDPMMKTILETISRTAKR